MSSSETPKDVASAQSTSVDNAGGALNAVHHSTPPTSTSLAKVSRKQPPAEKARDVSRRSYVVFSFWAIVVFLGLPIWWHTTTIHKAPLPLTRMTEWADGQACPPHFPIHVELHASDLTQEEVGRTSQLVYSSLGDFNAPAGAYVQVEPKSHKNKALSPEDKTALTIHLSAGDELAASLHATEPRLDVTYPKSALPTTLPAFLASQLRDIFTEEKDLVSYYLAQSAIPIEGRNGDQHQTVSADLAKRMTRTLRYAPTFHLTISLFTAGSTPSGWDIDAAIEEHMRPILDMLTPIHNFTIDTQIQLYANPSVQAEVLSKEHLTQFINAAEWPLSPSIGGAPTINFVIFAGNQTIITEGLEAATRSWLIPQWGSVYLLAPTSQGHVTSEELKAPIQTFTSHLLTLLGTPQSASPVLRLSTLARVRAVDLILRASSSLGSLARLTNSLPSISIPESVADGITKSIQHLENACAALGSGASLQHAQIAEAEAERAFFEKSMVGQLYFPDEHKIAVYLPLLGPIGVPLIMGLLNEFKAWKKRRSAKLKST